MVRILAVSDIHGSQSGFLAIHELIKKHEPDILVIAGDITNFGPGDWAKKLLDSISIPTVAVNGNCDNHDIIHVLQNHETGLLNECREFRGLNFLGIAYPFSEDYEPSCQPDIIVTHVPPTGCNDNVPGHGSRGDEKLVPFVKKHKPKLLISGHIHESPGIVEMEGITCVNPGPAKDGRGALIDIEGDIIKARLVGNF